MTILVVWNRMDMEDLEAVLSQLFLILGRWSLIIDSKSHIPCSVQMILCLVFSTVGATLLLDLSTWLSSIVGTIASEM